VVQGVLLPVQLQIEVTVRLLSISQDRLVVVDLVAQARNHRQVALDAALVVIVLPALVFVEAGEIVLQIEQLLLQGLVVSLALSQLDGFLFELLD